MKLTKYLLVFWICFSAFYCSPASVTVQGNRLFVDGKPFFIKGLCYSPSYPGQGGGALVFRFLEEEIKEKDFQMMKEAGVNTLRVYEPMFDDFYKYVAKYDFKVIVSVISPGNGTNVLSETGLEDYKKEALKVVRKHKNNPNILMWSLWNDAPFNPNLVKKYGLKKVNEFFKKIYEVIKEEDPDHLITGANMINVTPGADMGFEFLDVIGCNVYLGLDFNGKAWENSDFSAIQAKNAMEILFDYSRRYLKPVFITETGFSTFKKINKQDEVLKRQLKIVGENLAGVCIFEWIDEWWKAGDMKLQDKLIEDHWGILDGYRNKKPGYDIIKAVFSATLDESRGFSKSLFSEESQNNIDNRNQLSTAEKKEFKMNKRHHQ